MAISDAQGFCVFCEFVVAFRPIIAGNVIGLSRIPEKIGTFPFQVKNTLSGENGEGRGKDWEKTLKNLDFFAMMTIVRKTFMVVCGFTQLFRGWRQ
jgi:hypothetical protein